MNKTTERGFTFNFCDLNGYTGLSAAEVSNMSAKTAAHLSRCDRRGQDHKVLETAAPLKSEHAVWRIGKEEEIDARFRRMKHFQKKQQRAQQKAEVEQSWNRRDVSADSSPVIESIKDISWFLHSFREKPAYTAQFLLKGMSKHAGWR